MNERKAATILIRDEVDMIAFLLFWFVQLSLNDLLFAVLVLVVHVSYVDRLDYLYLK